MEQSKLYEDIARRTEGDIYIGVVGPVRTGKSTFIKRFMETMVIPNIDNVYRRERARDELPQSGSGRTVMTAEPKFVPEEAVSVQLENGAAFSVRLIDCVGYLVPGATGTTEDDAPRMVTTPWFDYEIPMSDAAEIGTRKVIAEHSTIGIVVTTDGTITDIPREDYLEAEERVIQELKELGKPFLVVLNSAYPDSDRARAIRADLASRYDVTVVCADCLQLDEAAVTDIIKGVLYEFPVKELDLFLPPWVDALPYDHPIKSGLYTAIREGAEGMHRIRDVERTVETIGACDTVSGARITSISLGTGLAAAQLELPRGLFYDTLSEQSGFTIRDDGDLMELLSSLAQVKAEYDKVAGALEEVKATGYGIVVPSTDELVLEEPEIVKQGGRYGVRLKGYIGVQLANPDAVAAIVNITPDKVPTAEQIDNMLVEARATPASTYIFCHPKVLSLLNKYKGNVLQTMTGDMNINRSFAAWNGIRFITSYNFKNGSEDAVSLA